MTRRPAGAALASSTRPSAPAKPATSPQPARSRGGRPTKKAAEELGQLILDTAARLFSEQGFAATTMEQVAAACGAGKDTIYRRYPSKAALFSALMEQLQTRVLSEIEGALSQDGPPLERLRSYSRKLLDINLRPELVALNRVALAEAVPIGGVRAPAMADDPLMVRFASLVRAAQTADLLIEGDPLFIAEQLLYATSIKPMIRSMLGETLFVDPNQQELYFAKAWDMALSGISGPRRLNAN